MFPNSSINLKVIKLQKMRFSLPQFPFKLWKASVEMLNNS